VHSNALTRRSAGFEGESGPARRVFLHRFEWFLMPRLHIFGASGSGATTLGRDLAVRLGIAYFDSDDFLWLPTDPAYTRRRPDSGRTAMLLDRLDPAGNWIFSGSALGWGSVVEDRYNSLIFLHLDPRSRLQRLRQREFQRFGTRILPGGDMAEGHTEFITWAAEYDSGTPEGRSLVAHEAWMTQRRLPLLRLDSVAPVDSLIAAALAWLASLEQQ
jgi:adenylate kinase family enzyme